MLLENFSANISKKSVLIQKVVLLRATGPTAGALFIRLMYGSIVLNEWNDYSF